VNTALGAEAQGVHGIKFRSRMTKEVLLPAVVHRDPPLGVVGCAKVSAASG